MKREALAHARVLNSTYQEVMGENLKFFKEKVKQSDRDVSTVVCVYSLLKHFLLYY